MSMIVHGKQLAEKILIELKKEIVNLKIQNIIPKIVIITSGNDEAWKTYVRIKEKRAKELGIQFEHLNISSDQVKLINLVKQINVLQNIHGFIVQRPLPPNIDKSQVTQTIDPKKDIDGFREDSRFEPPVWLAVKKILEEIFKLEHILDEPMKSWEMKFQNWLKTKQIVLIGKGETAGNPTIQGLKKLGIVPNIVDSKTQNRKEIFQKADIIISAAGKTRVVEAKNLKKDVILIGIGIHKENNIIKGDYDEEDIKNIASYYTSTPGGIGPLNLAFLFKNLIQAAKQTTS